MFVNICVDPAITCKAMHRCRRNGGEKKWQVHLYQSTYLKASVVIVPIV